MIWDNIQKVLRGQQPNRGQTDVLPSPKDMEEVVDRLPEEYREYVARELPYRRISAIAFITLCLVCGLPLWWRTTTVYRAHMHNVPSESTKIDLDIHINLVPTSLFLSTNLRNLEDAVLMRLTEMDTPAALRIKWNVFVGDLTPVKELPLDRISNRVRHALDVDIALVNPDDWAHFSASYAFLTCSHWSLLQFGNDVDKTANRVVSLIWETLIDIPHLESIVKRDQREKMAAWQIQALPLSHQKRLVWDSAALAGENIVQIVFLHDNVGFSKGTPERMSTTVDHIWRFAHRIQNATKLRITSEHLWDFEITHYLEKDVQERMTLTADSMQNILREVDMQMQAVESASPIFKLLVLETKTPVVILDHTGEDSRGVAIASWGAVVGRSENTDAQLLAGLRVLLGIDSEMDSGRLRESCPLSDWEITRVHLRAYVDNTLRARSAVRALHNMKDQVAELVISDEVAELVNGAISLLQEATADPHQPRLAEVSDARKMADSALSDPSLLALLYFPQDQKMAVYLPIAAPTLLPLVGSLWALFKWGLGRR